MLTDFEILQHGPGQEDAPWPFEAQLCFARRIEAAALESQALEMEGLRKQLSDSAKCAFEAMPHDIPIRMKRRICVDADWSGSLASRSYIEIRKAFTGEPYKANEDLDKALTALAAAESRFWEACQPHGKVGEVVYLTYKTKRDAAMAAKGASNG